VRIISVCRAAALVSVLAGAVLSAGLPGASLAQTDATKTDQPADGQTNFGPRKKPAAPVAQAGQKAPPVEVVGTFGKWTVQCGAVQDGKGDAAKQCGMSQVTKSEKNDKIGLSMVIAKSKQGDKTLTMMRILAPIGVYLPTGIALEIDGAAVGRVPFTRCRPTICEALAEASAPTLAKMKQGTVANFIIYEAPGLGIPLKITLEGFSKALAELDKQN
jgi:invasion protein IalB